MGQFKIFITKLGNSLFHWTSYLGGVERISVLRESAFDYAISEFLEVNKHGITEKKRKKVNNNPMIIDYTFRDPHPVFVKRSVDLFANVQIDSAVTLYSEFKFVRREVASDEGNELQRYFNDLFRLLAIQKNTGSNTKCIFIVIGKARDFGECLKKGNNVPTGIISFFLSFNEERREINTPLKDNRLNRFYSVFKEDYRHYKKGKKELTDQDSMITRLVYTQQGLDKPVNVCIWEIECHSGNKVLNE